MNSTITIESQTEGAQPQIPRTQTTSVAAAPPQRFVKRHPLLIFFTIAFAISFAGILLVLRLGGVQGGVAPTATPFQLMMLAWLAGPSVASLVMTGLVSGRSGARGVTLRLPDATASAIER